MIKSTGVTPWVVFIDKFDHTSNDRVLKGYILLTLSLCGQETH